MPHCVSSARPDLRIRIGHCHKQLFSLTSGRQFLENSLQLIRQVRIHSWPTSARENCVWERPSNLIFLCVLILTIFYKTCCTVLVTVHRLVLKLAHWTTWISGTPSKYNTTKVKFCMDACASSFTPQWGLHLELIRLVNDAMCFQDYLHRSVTDGGMESTTKIYVPWVKPVSPTMSTNNPIVTGWDRTQTSAMTRRRLTAYASGSQHQVATQIRDRERVFKENSIIKGEK
jgi:hypothetical protein